MEKTIETKSAVRQLHEGWLPLQSVHLQELQLLSRTGGAGLVPAPNPFVSAP